MPVVKSIAWLECSSAMRGVSNFTHRAKLPSTNNVDSKKPIPPIGCTDRKNLYASWEDAGTGLSHVICCAAEAHQCLALSETAWNGCIVKVKCCKTLQYKSAQQKPGSCGARSEGRCSCALPYRTQTWRSDSTVTNAQPTNKLGEVATSNQIDRRYKRSVYGCNIFATYHVLVVRSFASDDVTTRTRVDWNCSKVHTTGKLEKCLVSPICAQYRACIDCEV